MCYTPLDKFYRAFDLIAEARKHARESSRLALEAEGLALVSRAAGERASEVMNARLNPREGLSLA